MIFNKKSLVVSSLMIVFFYRIKCVIFVGWSTIMYMVLKKLDGDKSMLKSMKIKNINWFGIGNDCKSLYRQCRGFFDVCMNHKRVQSSWELSTLDDITNLEKWVPTSY